MELTCAIEAEEWAALEAEWGVAPRVHHVLDVDHPFLTGDHQRLVSDGRRAEICYIMHRGTPADGVLLHIKTIYPDGAFRLPTGGIHAGESVLDTLAREIYEETGLQVGAGDDAVQVERFLGVAGYEFRHPQLGKRDFATYHFVVRMPPGAVLAPQDPSEMIAGWQWVPAAALATTAEALAGVGDITPVWRDWGRYRALSHRFVATHL